jgi:H+/gluconate symporter-like permease
LISINNVNNNYIITEGTDNEINNIKKQNMYIILSIAIIVTLIMTIIMTLLIIKYCKKNKKVIEQNRENIGNTGNTSIKNTEVENTSVEIKMDNEKDFQDINLE